MWTAFELTKRCATAVPTRYGQVGDGVPQGDGIGTATQSLTSTSEALYCLDQRLVGSGTGGVNGFYAAPFAQLVPIPVYANSGNVAAAGGSVADPAGGTGNFGLIARRGGDGDHADPTDQLVYVWRGKSGPVPVEFRLKSSRLTSLSRSGGSAHPLSTTLVGIATYQVLRLSDGAVLTSNTTSMFSATVRDVGSGAGTDSFALIVYDRHGTRVHTVPARALTAGSVVIRR